MRALAIIIALPLILPGSVAATEQTYKWRDERGAVHYGHKPPPGVRAESVDTQPNISQSTERRDCVGPACARGEVETQRPRPDEAQPATNRALQGAADSTPRGLDFDVYIRLKSGMSEGELLQRAGPPDFESVENLRGPIGKSFYYYPTSANPFTTIVTLRGGRIFNIERIKKF